MSNSTDEQVIEELRLTNRLLAHLLTRDKETQKERILILKGCGFSPSEIADTLKIRLNAVTSTLTKAKKAKKEKPK